MWINPEELQKFLDGLRSLRTVAPARLENLQETRWVLKDTAGMDLPFGTVQSGLVVHRRKTTVDTSVSILSPLEAAAGTQND